MVGQESNNDESEYRKEIEGFVMSCNDNDFSLNVGKTKKTIIDFRKKGGDHAPIYINRVKVERVKCIKFLRVMITDRLSWTSHIDVMVKKAQQCLFILRQLRKFGVSIRSFTNSYICTIESILSMCIMVRYINCCAQDRKKLQKVVYIAQAIMEANLLSMDSIYSSCCCGKTVNIIKDPSQL
eukprot:g36995.t1